MTLELGRKGDLLGRVDALGDALIEAAGVDSTAAMAMISSYGFTNCDSAAQDCAAAEADCQGWGGTGLGHSEEGEQGSGKKVVYVLHIYWKRFDTSGLNLCSEGFGRHSRDFKGPKI